MSTTAETIICVGHTAWDRIYTVETVAAPPAKIRAASFLEIGGGMAANAAVAIAHLGGAAQFWGPAGDDGIAARMHQDFARHGVNDTHMQRGSGHTSSHSAILVDARGERLIVGIHGSVLEQSADWLPLDKIAAADALLADVRWPQGARLALAAARRAGVPTVLDGDTATREVLHGLAGLADYCVFSEPGFAAFIADAAAPGAGHAAASVAVPAAPPDYALCPIGAERTRSGLAQALALGARFAAVTRGERGCEWLDAAQPASLCFTPAFKVTAVDTTGAGDTFHGAFALLLAEGWPVQDIVRFASAAAAIKVTRAGARSMPTRDEVERLLAAA